MKIDIERKCFDGKEIFSSQSFSFPDGKVSVILGPSGCGKTTLLRMLASLETDYLGRSEGLPHHAVMLFQEDRLVENISVLSNLKAVTDDEARCYALLDNAGLANTEKETVRTLSGGMKRRVALIRALLVDGDALFLDEPFTGLDDETKKTMARMIEERTTGKTVIAVSHAEEDIALLGADAVIRL